MKASWVPHQPVTRRLDVTRHEARHREVSANAALERLLSRRLDDADGAREVFDGELRPAQRALQVAPLLHGPRDDGALHADVARHRQRVVEQRVLAAPKAGSSKTPPRLRESRLVVSVA